MYDDVRDFHFKFGIPVAGSGPCVAPSQDVIEYRTKFLQEELYEFKDACAEENLAEAFDALLDIAWVAMGTAHYFGAPWDEGWAEVVRANMDRVTVTRENCPPEKQYRKDMVMKPPGWRAPELLRVIRDHNMRVRQQERQLDIPEFLRKFPDDELTDEPGVISEFIVDGKQKEVKDLGQNMSVEYHSFNCVCEKCVGNDEVAGD
jgi:predicted HAD superfamily Cof-like phosphohydrolase